MFVDNLPHLGHLILKELWVEVKHDEDHACLNRKGKTPVLGFWVGLDLRVDVIIFDRLDYERYDLGYVRVSFRKIWTYDQFGIS